MALHWIIVLIVIVGIGLAYNIARDVVEPVTQWWDTTLNGVEYCPDGEIETVKLALEYNGIGLEHTRTKDNKFCFQTHDNALAGRVIEDIKQKQLERDKVQIAEDGKTDRMFLLFLIVGILALVVIWLLSRNSGSSFL